MSQRGAPANDPYEPDARDYRLLRAVLEGERTAEQIVSVLNESGLRGMGGAGFPTGKKWDLVANQEARPKYAICNADESEPGTFKDRQIMAEQPHLVLEGMLIGMAVTEAHEGWVFIRHEYGPEEEVLREEIERLRGLGVLDGSDLEIDVFVSPGGYILGEESALLECMEGHRGEPRNKPPFPGVYGLRGKPTLMNSVETFAHVPVILERGADWWNAQGVHDGTGLKFFAVSGHVERPDVYCVQMGTTARELIELAGGVSGGAELLAFQPGGASSNFLGPDDLDVPLDFGPLQEAGSMLGSGAVTVIAEGTDLLAAGTNVLAVLPQRVVRKCVPCRVGSHKAHEMLTEALGTEDGPADLKDRLTELEATVRLTSICGLGQVALGPVMRFWAWSARHGGSSAPAPVAMSPPHSQREFFAVRTLDEALTGFRPSRRTGAERIDLGEALGASRPSRCGRRTPAGLRARPWTAMPSARPTPMAPPRAFPPTWSWPARRAWGGPAGGGPSGDRRRDRHRGAARARRRRRAHGRAHPEGCAGARGGAACPSRPGTGWCGPTRTPLAAPSSLQRGDPCAHRTWACWRPPG